MSIPRALLAILCLTSLTLIGCSKGSNSDQGNAQMRVVNAFSQANALDVTVNAKPVVSTLPFQSSTQYNSTDSGSQIVTVGVTGASTALVNSTYNLGSNTNFSFVIFGPQTAVGALLLNDAFNNPGDGFFAMRFINAAPGPAGLDLYLTAPGADLSATAPAVSNTSYASSSLFLPIAIGNLFQIRITPAGTKDVIYDSASQTFAFAEHSGTSIVAFGKGSGKLVNVAILRDDDAGTSLLVDNLLTQYKMVNASLAPSALNVFVDGSLQLSNVPFTGVSTYQRTTAGAHTFNIEATTTPGASLLTLAPSLAPATDTAIVVTGTAGALTTTLYNNPNFPPALGQAIVRFVNSTIDVAALDVFINFSRQVSGLTMNSASAGIALDADPTAGTTYEFDFNVSGTSQASLQLPAVQLLGGHLYTIYVVGPRSALAGVVSQDN